MFSTLTFYSLCHTIPNINIIKINEYIKKQTVMRELTEKKKSQLISFYASGSIFKSAYGRLNHPSCLDYPRIVRLIQSR